MDRVGITYSVRLDDFATLLTDLRDRGQIAIIECESLASDQEDEFCMGRVMAIENDSIQILCVDTLGVWDDEPWVVYFRNITKVQFDTPYINMYAKYAEKPPC